MSTTEFPAIAVSVAPTMQPLTIAEGRRILRLAPSETGHDQAISELIQASAEQFLTDTGIVLINTTYTHTVEHFDNPMQLTHRPISSITSVKYYDSANAQQTLASSVYVLDVSRRQVRLKPDQSWPAIYSRWDAVEVKYVAGEGATQASVSETYRQALALRMRYDFDGDEFHLRAYENLIMRYLRSSYP